MASPALTDLQNQVFALLHEAQDSPIGELDASPGGSATITTPTQITTFLNEGAADLCRNAIPVPGNATALNQSAMSYTYEGLGATASGGQLWYARAVSFNGVSLKPASKTTLSIWFPTWQTDVTGTPLYWCRNGASGFDIYPQPNASGALKAAGFEIPKPLSGNTDTLALWVPDHLTKLVVWYATAQMALQNEEDMSIKGRAVTWSQAYLEGMNELQKQLWQSDPALAKALWGLPPQGPAMGAQPPQQG